MIKLALLAFAYLIYLPIDSAPVEKYYFYCSAVYSIIALASFIAYVKSNSLMILFYMLVNYLYAVLHLLVNLGFYESLKGIIWHDSINFSLIVTWTEAVLLLGGVGSVLVFIANMHLTDTSKHTSINCSVVHTE